MRINSKKEMSCTGCTACVNKCPSQAIYMARNKEGFWKAFVDEERCTDCGVCLEICHLNRKKNSRQNRRPVFYAAFSKDIKNVEQSSSGGIFYELCKYILEQSGVVYGAVQTSVSEVEHQRGEKLEEIRAFRRSKYLESNMGDSYKRAEKDLKDGKKVLFSGVGCQIAGLYSYLQKEYETLYTCEVVCHGIPSHLAYEKYLEEKSLKCKDNVCGINFRDKSRGWKNNGICEYFEGGGKEVSDSSTHPLHSVYLKGINMRSICGTCQYAHIPRIADITLADFWQYEGSLAELNANKGISLIAVNNQHGIQLLNGISDNIYLDKTEEETALRSCRHMNHSPILYKSQASFLELLQSSGYHVAAKLCSGFGPVIREIELCKMTELYEDNVMRSFFKDEQEIIYIPDQEGKLGGIVTFENFIRNYTRRDKWIKHDFEKILLSETCAGDVKQIFDSDSDINRIPIIDENGFLIYEVRRNGAKHREMELIVPFLQLGCLGIQTYFVKRPDLLTKDYYTQEEWERIKSEMSFPRLSEDIAGNEKLLKELLKEKFSCSYVEELRKVPQIVEKNDRYQHIDYTSDYINIVGGYRKTYYQPRDYAYTVHIYGRCGVFGYAVEDSDTMPSALQYLFVKDKQKIRVINHGLWGADDQKILHNLSVDIAEGFLKKNDKVVLYMNYLPCMRQLKGLKLQMFDTTSLFHEFLKGKTIFYDRPGHMTADGYRYMADIIYHFLEQPAVIEIDEETKRNVQAFLSHYISFIKKGERGQGQLNETELENYLSTMEKKLPQMEENKVRGAIVMNCNPFTKGHRYLIEMAAKEVDELLLFVLEEDKSFFPFTDRFQMVKDGTRDLENVYVLPSGKFMISALTFPEYFIKEQQQDIKINPVSDVQLFARNIAPRLHISIRFVGTEPKDKVTNQYNDTLREQLPCYGITLKEVERLNCGNEVVTATEVRKMLVEENEERLLDFVPKTTFDYLSQNGYLKGDSIL